MRVPPRRLDRRLFDQRLFDLKCDWRRWVLLGSAWSG